MKIKNSIIVLLLVLIQNLCFAQQNIPLTVCDKQIANEKINEQTVILNSTSGSRIIYNVTQPSI